MRLEGLGKLKKISSGLEPATFRLAAKPGGNSKKGAKFSYSSNFCDYNAV
jgi:hypothetical protein